MSTELGSVKGETEVVRTEPILDSDYIENELLVTSFWGGVGRGRCVQLTLHYPNRGFIQLTRKEAKKLIKLLQQV